MSDDETAGALSGEALSGEALSVEGLEMFE